jgi:hypothetical protein
MFLLDSLLLAPGKAVLFMFEELAKKAQEEFLDDDSVKQELQDIYARLEGGTISEQEFETRELGLMQRLEQIARAKFEGSWGTPAMGLQRAFLQGQPEEDANVVVTEAVIEPEVLPAPVVDVQAPAEAGLSRATADTADIATRMAAVDAGAGAPGQLLAELAAFVAGAKAPALLLSDPAAAGAGTEAPTLRPDSPLPAAVAPELQPPRPAAPTPPAALTMAQVIESTMRHLSMLKLKLSAVTAVSRTDDGWRVTAEMLERKAVPDTSDLLGVYDLQLDAAGNVLRYERTHMRRRADLGR